MKHKKGIIIIAVIAAVVLLFTMVSVIMVLKNRTQTTTQTQTTSASASQTTSETAQSTTHAEAQTVQLPSEGNNNKIKVACVGDSITYGYGIENRDKDSYPAQLGAILGEKYEVVNFGISGRTAMLSADKPYMYEEIYRQSKDYQPDIVVLMLGTNDTKKINWNKTNFFEDFQLLIESYENLPSYPKVYVMTPPPLYLDKNRPTYPNQDTLVKETIPLIKLAANKENVELIDLYTPFWNKPYLLSDGCHPNETGAEAIAKIVYSKIGVMN